jgi:tetratricopeptide (TPR) repeat protein
MLSNTTTGSDCSNASGEQLIYDDEPLGSILYKESGPGPSPASIFLTAYPRIAEIEEMMAAGQDANALSGMVDLIEARLPFSDRAALIFVRFISRFFPSNPKPIVTLSHHAWESILREYFDMGRKHRNSLLTTESGELLYRWLESAGRYAEAREVLRLLLRGSRERGDLIREALWTNNLGYEYLLEGMWYRAEPYFTRSVRLFEGLGIETEVANIEVNILTCRFETEELDKFQQLESQVKDAGHRLCRRRDWRRRKVFSLLANLEERRGNLHRAIRWARCAVYAAKDVPTQLHSEDMSYFQHLERQTGIGNESF